jgi:hypothetical protein
MIRELLPTAYARHLSLPLLGPSLDEFDEWLIKQGYRFNSRQMKRQAIARTGGLVNSVTPPGSWRRDASLIEWLASP